MVIYAANSCTYYYYVFQAEDFQSRLKTFVFCKSFPLHPFFFFKTDYMIPQTFTVTSSISLFLPFSFLFYNI